MVGLLALAAIFVLGMIKGANRQRLDGWCSPATKPGFAAMDGFTSGIPLATWVWMYSLLVSAAKNTIEWRGRRYRLSVSRFKKV